MPQIPQVPGPADVDETGILNLSGSGSAPYGTNWLYSSDGNVLRSAPEEGGNRIVAPINV